MKYLIPFLALFSFLSFAGLPENLTFVTGCNLLGHDGRITKYFPGMLCVFFPDGKLLSADSKLTMFDAEDKILWSMPYLVHHQIKLSRDGQRIITMLSEAKDETRRDIFAVIDLEGKIIHSAYVDELLKGQIPFEKWELSEWEKNRFHAKYEYSHFNSIYEIPKNSSKLPFMKEGNIVVNNTGIVTCVLTPDLKTVLDCRKMPDNVNVLHDAQITEEGKYLYFNNEVKDKSGLPSSAVEEFDPKSMKKKVLFAAEPKVAFFSPVCGGVQVIGDFLVVSHVVGGAYIVNRKTGKIADYVANPDLRKDQEIKAFDLGPFLTARKQKE